MLPVVVGRVAATVGVEVAVGLVDTDNGARDTEPDVDTVGVMECVGAALGVGESDCTLVFTM